MENKLEQLKEDPNQEEEKIETSKKRQKNINPLCHRILIIAVIVTSILSVYLLYKLCSSCKSSSNFMQLAESRFSVRKFLSKPVEPEKINKILKVVQLAPTAANLQPQKVYVITKEEDKKKLESVTKYTFNAPMFLLVCSDKTKAWKHKNEEIDSTEIDGSIVATHILFEVHELGLGTTFVRSFETEKLKKLLNIPENMVPVALLPIGYPHEEAKPSKYHYQKKDIKQLVQYL